MMGVWRSNGPVLWVYGGVKVLYDGCMEEKRFCMLGVWRSKGPVCWVYGGEKVLYVGCMEE